MVWRLTNKGLVLSRLSVGVSLLVLFFIGYHQLSYARPYAATWDQVDFALALTRYDLMAMQPHFPGYPYFILGGMLTHKFVSNPAQALSIFNGLMMCSASIPIYLIAKRYQPASLALLTTTLIQSSGYIMISIIQPMSEGAATAALWWYIWALLLAKEKRNWLAQVLPLFLFSVVLGIRLSYFPFAVGILLLWWHEWKLLRNWKRLFILGIVAFLFQGIWVSAIIVTEGGVVSFVKLALSFTSGHFNEWGGTAGTDEQPFWSRAIRLIFYNLIWTGLSVQSYISLFMYVLLLVSLFFRKESFRMTVWPGVMAMMYFIWALAGQNIDKPRHIIPIIGVVFLYVWLFYFKTKLSIKNFLIAATVLTLQISAGSLAVKEQADSLPAAYQLAYDLERKEEQFILYTWEESRVLHYLGATFPFERIYSFSTFSQRKSYYKHATIYLTDHVVKGFEEQGINTDGKVKKIQTYQSSLLADPVYGDITLYKWIQ